MLTNTKQLAARLRGKISNKLDELNAKLDDPKEMERFIMNPLAYAAFAMACAVPVLLIIDSIMYHRFAWWGLIMGILMYQLAKAMYIPSPKKHERAEQVRARLIAYKEAAERKVASKAAVIIEKNFGEEAAA